MKHLHLPLVCAMAFCLLFRQRDAAAQPWLASTVLDPANLCPREPDRLQVLTQVSQIGYSEPSPRPPGWTWAPPPRDGEYFFNVPTGTGWTAGEPHFYPYGQNTWWRTWDISVHEFARRAGFPRWSWSSTVANLSNLGTPSGARDLRGTWWAYGGTTTLMYLQDGPDRAGNRNAAGPVTIMDANRVPWSQTVTLHCIVPGAAPLPQGSLGGNTVVMYYDNVCYTWRCREDGTFVPR